MHRLEPKWLRTGSSAEDDDHGDDDDGDDGGDDGDGDDDTDDTDGDGAGVSGRVFSCLADRSATSSSPSSACSVYLLRHDNVPIAPYFPHSFAIFLHDGCLALYRWRAAAGWIYNETSDIARFIFPLELE